jgi:predicted adenylyl cyclase CyaB
MISTLYSTTRSRKYVSTQNKGADKGRVDGMSHDTLGATMASLEIEIKSLLGSRARADALRSKLHECDPHTKLISENTQLNHYFIGGDFDELYKKLKKHLAPVDAKKFKEIIALGSDFSLRTRLIDNRQLLFVLKASRDEGTSHNTISRLEFEVEISNMTLEELDRLILDCGFEYQAKWSRAREEYICKNVTVCLDKNSGYGYLAEFEKMVSDELQMKTVEKEIRSFMEYLGVEEIPQDRLERMFDHYNAHWQEYYGTDNIFIVK